jgi:hypothetical protein
MLGGTLRWTPSQAKARGWRSGCPSTATAPDEGHPVERRLRRVGEAMPEPFGILDFLEDSVEAKFG